MKTRLFMLGSAIAILTVAPASAHHSLSIYDRHKLVTLSGTVKEFIWSAPHVAIHIEAENGGGGRRVTWPIEGSSPSVLARGGWTGSVIRPGDKISLGIHPRKDSAAGGLLADAQQMLVNGEPPKGVLWLKTHGDDSYD